MKLSMFNEESKTENGLLIYNSATSGIILLNEEYTKKYQQIKEGADISQYQDLIAQLEKCGMLVDDSIDEVSEVKIKSRIVQHSNEIDFTIAPTMNCNFACPYCYEEGVRYNEMTKEVADKTIEFILNQTNPSTPLSIFWYGGEPLLNMKMIRYITNRIQENPDKFRSYSSAIVTNGYLLTHENAEILKDLGIHNAQITLDGAPDAHDSRRYLKGSKGPTFMKILDNIKESCDLINISIRVNVDKTNINHIDQLLDIIHEQGLKDKVTLYISPVSDTAGKPDPNCFTSKEFSKEQINFYTRMIDNGTEIVSVPEANYGVCSAISPFSFLVDPLGNLYKCWNDVGRIEMNVGNVFEGQKTNSVLSSYLNYDAFDNAKCHSCSVLPLCLGGCPYEKNKLGRATCGSIKFNINDIIKFYYDSKIMTKERSHL